MENEIDERGTDVERYTPDYIYIYSCLGYTNTGDRRFFQNGQYAELQNPQAKQDELLDCC